MPGALPHRQRFPLCHDLLEKGQGVGAHRSPRHRPRRCQRVYREPIGKRFSGGWKAVFWRSESGGMGVVPAPLGCGAGTFLLNSFLW